MGIGSPGGRHLSALKARGAGFSFSEAWDGCYNYTFFDGSNSYFFAGREDYLIKDGILNKVQEGLDFLNKHTPWGQNRSKKDTLMHMKANWVDDEGLVHGTNSEIIGVIVDNPNKTRGKRGRKITFEEAGSFPKLKDALEISLGSIRDGSAYLGQVSVFGTGGEEGPGIEGLDDIFSSPEAWDMLMFPNVWEPGMESADCGYFVPCWRVNNLAIDPEGNVDMDLALDLENVERDKKKKSSDPKALDRRKAEYPTNPSEALMRLTVNDFPIGQIDAQIKRFKSNKTMQGFLRHGNFIDGDKGVEFVPDPEAKPLVKYPHTRNDDLSGCITLMEEPFKIKYEGKDQVPGEIGEVYFITVDPVQLEDAEDLTSLWDIRVWKQYNVYDSANSGLPVAWYTGRPKMLETAWEIVAHFAKFFKAKIHSEIAGGGQALYTYLKKEKMLEYVAYEMSMDTKEIDQTELNKNRRYFTNVTTDQKNNGIKYMVNWCSQSRGLDYDGNKVTNLHRVFDLGFLMEMKKFRKDRNADRISSSTLAMFVLKKGEIELENMRREETGKQGFFDRKMFSSGASSRSGVTSAY